MNEIEKDKSRSRNALVHGLYAKDVLLPWDSKDDFEKLHADLRAEFMPNGRAEEETVLDLTFLYWRKQTLWRMWQTAVIKDKFTRDILETNRKSWSGIRKRLRSAAWSERTLLGKVDAQQGKILSQIARLRKEIDATSDQQEVKLIEEKIKVLMGIVNKHGNRCDL
jgi:hypothetical protein